MNRPAIENRPSPQTAADYLIAHGLLPLVDPYTQELFLRRAKAGDLDAVRAYLVLGMPVDVRDPDNQGTALIRAADWARLREEG